MRRWAAGGADPRPVAAIGASIDGSVDIDLVRDGPHGLIAGTTGAGKSELLRTLVVALAANVGPDHLSFVLVDYKGGSTFDACIDLPHTVGVVTDLDDGLAERALVSLEAELRRREAALREVAATDLTEYRATSGAVPLPRLVVVVDEFAALAKELPSFLASLVGVAQRGRSLGVHLLLATQRPSGVVSDEIRSNTNLRIALRLNDSSDAHDVVGDDQPSRFPRSVPGRVAMRLGPGELIVFQAARCSAPRRAEAGRLRIERAHAEPPGPCPHESGAHVDTAPSEQPTEGLTDQSTELRATVAAIRDAARRAGVAEPHRPWCAPLPERVAPSELAGLLGAGSRRRTGAPPAPPAMRSGVDPFADAVGILDDPTHQCRRALRWRSDAGNLALVGSLGSGTTTALLALAAVQCRTNPVDRCHLYAVDANGDASLDLLSSLAHCGAVVRARERERLARLLRRLVGEIDARASLVAPTDIRIVLLIDGLAALRASLSSVDDAPRLAELDRVLAEGPAVGVVTAFTVDATASCASTAPAAERWLFHIDDPVIARGIAPGVPVPGDVPGRMRLASSGLAGQIAHGEDVVDGLPRRGSRTTRRGRSACGSATGAREIVTLPELVHAVDLEPSSQHGAPPGRDAPSQHLAIGLSADDVTTASMRLPLGEHVFVGGLSHTGKSSALDRIVSAWRAVVPDGRVVIASRNRPVTRTDLVAREPEAERARVAVVRPASGVACIDAAPPVLVAIDDAERVDDPHGVLRAILDGGHPNVTIAVAASLDAVRAAYGHWTRDVARSRCGLIMTASGEIDGDLLGVTLPRRSLIAARPGLAWLVDGSGHRLVQVAIDR
jgi:S-DNA-T family DNA segregation ATPase FtsK/SpoIIIE